MERERVSVQEAARQLGITESAVRKRASRKQLRSEKVTEGKKERLYIFLDAEQDEFPEPFRERYVKNLEDQAEYLRQQLDQEREARTEERRRHDTVVAQLTQANAALAARIPEQLEASATEEGTDAPETAWEASEGAESRSATGGAQESVQRPWWWRIFRR